MDKTKLRSVGVIRHDNKILCVCMKDNDFFCLPGGYIEFGEDSETAVIREIKEETLYETQIVKFLGLIENFYDKDNVRYHEIGFYYLLDLISPSNYQNFSLVEDDHGVITPLEFRWLDSVDLLKYNFYPREMVELLSKSTENFHLIIKNGQKDFTKLQK